MHLLSDMMSVVDPKCCYGKRGDVVRVISKHHDVAIVEGSDGVRFPAPMDQLSRDEVKPDQVPVAAKQKKAPTKSSKQKVYKPTNQLF